ncbi:MAG: Gfo/Idh/MocA family protein [Chloroflexota bacterium]
MERLPLALVGCGPMGRRHIRGLGALTRAGLDGIDLVAVCDLDPRFAARAADEVEAETGRRPRVVASVDELLRDDAIRAIDIATDPAVHHRIAVPALLAGRHVLCEKPLSVTIRGCRAILDAHAAAPAGTVLATEEHFRRGPANRVAKAVVASGMIGAVHLIRTTWAGGDDRILLTPWRHLREKGPIALDNGVHMADVQQYLAGARWEAAWGRGFIAEPVRRRGPVDFSADMYAEAMAAAPDEVIATGEDSVVALYRMESGASAFLSWIPSGPGHTYLERSVHGRDGSIVLPPDRSGGDLIVRLAGRSLGIAELVGELPADTIDEPTARLFGDPVHPDRPFAEVDAAHLAVTLHDFARAVLDGRPPEVDGAEGMDAVAAILAAFASAPLGRAVSREEILSGAVGDGLDDVDRLLGLA